jgi:hypothetical protein
MSVFNTTGPDTTDLYGTPRCALNLLLPHLKGFRHIWEPCCGFGAISEVLLSEGWKVTATDLSLGMDALLELPPMWEGIDAVVTNPPYSRKTEFLARCYALQKPFALLLPCDLVNRIRTPLMAKHGVQLIVPDRRIKFLRFVGGMVREASSPNMGSCWFTWGLNLPQDILFKELR